MNQRVSPKTSITIYCLCDAIFILIILLLRNFFRSSPIAITLCGFLGSQLFFFLVITIGQGFEICGIKRKPGWIHINITLIIANIICFYIHPFCTIACFAFSIPIGIYLIYSAKLNVPVSIKSKFD